MCSETKKNSWKKSEISIKYPTYRDIHLKTVHSWFAGKRIDDNAEGLWRVHNGIYDFTKFIKYHPGGSSWLKQTKGTDITEAFEAHHISLRPENLLEQFKICDASKPRNILFTFHSDGFYKTLKKRVREKMEYIDKSPTKKTDFIHSTLVALTFLLSIESLNTKNMVLILFAGIMLCWTVIASHNYFHRRDNWRMYAFNLSFMSYRDWRVSHALSHHIYTNSYHDLELSMFEPFFCWIPNPYIKNWFQRYISWIYGPVIYAFIFAAQIATRIAYTFVKQNILYWDDLISLILPLTMYIVSGKGFLETITIWLAIETVASFVFGLIGLNAAHHHPKLFHDGDALRKDRDWGLFQLDSVTDRSDLKGSQFLALTHFGDHALHHLFPTLDHGILPQLYPILFKTVEEFKGQLEDCPWIEHIIGQLEQLARIIPNKIPPGE